MFTFVFHCRAEFLTQLIKTSKLTAVTLFSGSQRDFLLFDVCRATTLYDRPASIFRETPLKLQHELFVRLAAIYPQFRHAG